jgi:hypothetical protein
MDASHCQQPVPHVLSGDLRPGPCMLLVGPNGRHANDHKAHLTITGVGRVTFRWKNRVTDQPPVITLPPPPPPSDVTVV